MVTMPQAPSITAASADRSKTAGRRQAGRPFLGMIDAVVVASPVEFIFDGAIPSKAAMAAWTWMARDVASDLIDLGEVEDSPESLAAVESLMPELLTRARRAVADAQANTELGRKLQIQLEGDANLERLPIVLNALRCRALLEKAVSFGRAANAMESDAPLALALQSMPLNDKAVASLLMQAAVGQVANPSRLITAAIRIAGGETEAALQRAGFAPMVDALLAHAQNQIAPLTQAGTFGDMDLICRSVDRFHRLIRALTTYVELGRNGRWAAVCAGLTKTISERIEPKLRDVAPDLNMALRKREGTDRLDSDQVLSALNGMYLLAAVREARDSLALNALFEQVWTQTGQALEIHIERLLQQLRAAPADAIVSARLDAALKMAEIRFNLEYADTLRRAKESAQRRTG